MPAGTCLPVYRPVIIPFDVFLYLFEFRMMPHSANTLYPQFGQIVAHSQQLILVQHQIRRIYLDIQRLPTSITPGNQSDPTGYKHPDPPERVNTPLRRAETITNRFPFICLKLYPEIDIPLLEDKRNLVDNLQRDGTRITIFHTDSHFVFIAIGETVGTVTFCLNRVGTIE